MKKAKPWLPYILLFIFFLIILSLSPITGDDWANYLVGKTGLYHSIGNAIGMYFDWEGRFIGRILINILTYHKIIWNIANSLVLTLIIFLIIKLVKPKNKKTVLYLSLFTILLMNIYTFSEIVIWIAGNITYIFPIPLLFYYFYKIINKKDNTKGSIAILMLLNLILPMFVEHIAVILVVFNLFINIYSLLKERRINKKYFLYLIISIIGLLSMLLSPGTLKRSKIENIEFNKLNIIEKIFYNLPNFIYYTFFVNTYMNILMMVTNYYLIKENVNNKPLKIISYLYLIIPVFLISGVYLLNNLLNIQILLAVNQNNIFITIYFLSYIIIDTLLIYKTFDKKNNQKLIFYILGILVNMAMLFSPTWEYRTSALTYFLLSIAFIMIIDAFYKEKKGINRGLFAISIIGFIFYTTLYINIYKAQKIREESIKNQKNKQIIEIEKMPSFAICNINPESEFHVAKFKEYYKINKEIEIRLIEGNWQYLIFYSQK